MNYFWLCDSADYKATAKKLVEGKTSSETENFQKFSDTKFEVLSDME